MYSWPCISCTPKLELSLAHTTHTVWHIIAKHSNLANQYFWPNNPYQFEHVQWKLNLLGVVDRHTHWISMICRVYQALKANICHFLPFMTSWHSVWHLDAQYDTYTSSLVVFCAMSTTKLISLFLSHVHGVATICTYTSLKAQLHYNIVTGT